MIHAIEKKIRAVRRRLRMLRFYRGAIWGVSIATGLAALLFLADRIQTFGWSPKDKWYAWGILLGIGVLVAGVYAIFSRLTLFEAALAADLRLGLQERLSSAILLRNRTEDPAVALVVEDAKRASGRLHPKRDFELEVPRQYAHHVWPLVGLFLVHFLVPPMNWFSSSEMQGKEEEEVVVPEEVRQKQAEQIEKIAKKIEENTEGEVNEDMMEFAKELERLAQELKAGQKTPKQTLAEMSRVSEDVRLKRTELSRQMESYQKMASPVAAQHTKDLQQAMQRNQFDKAAEMAMAMAEQAAMDSPAAEKEQLAQELEDMANRMSQDQPEMAQALESAAEALKQAAEAQRQGNEEGQNEAMAQMQQAMEQAAEEMSQQADAAEMMQKLDQVQQSMEQQKREMARAMGIESKLGLREGTGSKPTESGNESGEAGQGQQSGQSAQGSGQPGESQMGQQSSQGMQGSQTAAGGSQRSGAGREGMGQGQMSGGSQRGQGAGSGLGSSPQTGPWAPGNTERTGPGMGGPGRGSGGQAPFDDSNQPGFFDTMPPGEKNPGEIIAVMKVDAPALKGESKVQYQQVFTEYRQKADDAISREEIPATLQPMVKDYFDAISPEAVGSGQE